MIGAIVAMLYVNHKQENTFQEMCGGNGVVVTDADGTQHHIQYFDIGKTEKSREEKRKLTAALGFGVYSIAVIGGKYFITLKKKTKEEIAKAENTQGGML